jgi:hypothetical protein
MADDLIINVRQIVQYPPVDPAAALDVILMQRNGLGGPYVTATAEVLVGTALEDGGNMTIGGHLLVEGATTLTSLAASTLALTGSATVGGTLAVTGPLSTTGGLSVTNGLTTDTLTSSGSSVVGGNLAVNGATSLAGQVVAGGDLSVAGNSQLTGALTSGNLQVNGNGLVSGNFGIQGHTTVTALTATAAATFTDVTANRLRVETDFRALGTATGVTPAAGDNSTSLATTQFVQSTIASSLAAYAPVVMADAPPPFALGKLWWDNVGSQLYVGDASSQWIIAVNQWPDARVSVGAQPPANPVEGLLWLDTGDMQTYVYTQGTWIVSVNPPMGAPINSPNFVGSPTVPTPPFADNSHRIPNTHWVRTIMETGEFGVASWNGRHGHVTLHINDITGAGGAPIVSPHFIGMPFSPTPEPGSNDGKVATTAFVMSEIAHHVAGVASWEGRTGHVTLQNIDIESLHTWAPLHSPNFTGDPHSVTPPAADDSTRIATTAYVRDRILLDAVQTFNNRKGHVLLTLMDIENVGGARISSPQFIGLPRAPTAPLNDDSTRLANTEWVVREVLHVTSTIEQHIDELQQDYLHHTVHRWNQRVGDVVMGLPDILAAHGAPIESPHFVGWPEGPTAQAHSDDDKLATTRYVDRAVKAVPSGPPGLDGPQGIQGPPGPPLEIHGSVPTFALLPTATANVGEVWETADTGTLYVRTMFGWEAIIFSDAPHDGRVWARHNGVWVETLNELELTPPLLPLGAVWAFDHLHVWHETLSKLEIDTLLTPPLTPTGAIWGRTHAGAWQLVPIAAPGPTPPATPSLGEVWYDTAVTPAQMKYWNGTAWQAIGTGIFLPLAGGTMNTGASITIDGGTYVASNSIYPLQFNRPTEASWRWELPPNTMDIRHLGTSNVPLSLSSNGRVTLGADPVAAMDAVTLQYLQTHTGAFLPLAGGTMAPRTNTTGGVYFTNTAANVGNYSLDLTNSNYGEAIAIRENGWQHSSLAIMMSPASWQVQGIRISNDVPNANDGTSIILRGTGTSPHLRAIAADNATEVFSLARNGTINTTGGYQVNGVSIGTPPFLPLAGGNVTGGVNFGTGQTSNVPVLIAGDNAAANLTIQRGWGTPSGTCLAISQLPWAAFGIDINAGGGVGLRMQNTSGAAGAHNILMNQTTTGAGAMLRVLNVDGVTVNYDLRPNGNVTSGAVTANGTITIQGPGAGYPQLMLNGDAAYGVGIRMSRGAGTQFAIGTDGGNFILSSSGYSAPTTADNPIVIGTGGTVIVNQATINLSPAGITSLKLQLGIP